jgi:hypothetical protein
MNRPMNNVLPLVLPRDRKRCWRHDLAKVIPLHPRRRPNRLSRAITAALAVVIIAAAVTACILILRSERDLIRELGPWTPLYCWPRV